MDIYQLGIAMDTSDLARGESALNSASDAANKAADALDSVSDSAVRTGDSLKTVTDTQQRTSTGAAQLASQYTGLSQATAAADGSAQKYLASLQREYDLLGLNRSETETYLAKTQGFTQQQQQLAAALGAKIDAWNRDEAAAKASAAAQDRAAASADQFIAKLQAQAQAASMTRTELLQMQAAQLGVSRQAAPLIAQIEGASTATGHFGGNAAGARREIVVLAHEMATGNWTRFGGSMMVLGERLDVLRLLLNPVALGIAAIGVAAYAMYSVIDASNERVKAFNDAMNTTSGYAGQTRESVQALAEALSSRFGVGVGAATDDMNRMIATGKISGDLFKDVAIVAEAMAQSTGESFDKVLNGLLKQQDGVSKAAQEYQAAHHTMTDAQLALIDQLEKTGQKHTAFALLIQQEEDDIAKTTRAKTSLMAGYWDDVKAAWDRYTRAVAGNSTDLDKLNDLKARQAAQQSGKTANYDYTDYGPLIDAQQKIVDGINADQAASEKLNKQKVLLADSQAEIVKQLERTMTPQQKLTEAIKNDNAIIDNRINLLRASGQYTDAEAKSLENLRQQMIATDTQSITPTRKGRTGQAGLIDRTQLTGEVQAVKDALAEELSYVSNAQKQLDALYKGGGISEQAYYQQTRDLIAQKYTDEIDAYTKDADLLKKGLSDQNLSAQQRAQISSQIQHDQALAAKAVEDFFNAVGDSAAKADEVWQKYGQSQVDATNKMADSAEAEAQKLRDQADTYGLTKSALDQLLVSRTQNQLAMDQEGLAMARINDLAPDVIANYEKMIAADQKLLKSRQDLLNAQNEVDVAQQFKKQQDDYVKTWQQTIDGIGTDFHNGFLQMLGDGKNSWSSFTKSLENTFETTVVNELYKAFAKPFIVSVIANIAGMTGGSGIQNEILQNNGMAGVNGISSLSNAYGMLSKGYGMASGYLGFGGETAGMTSDAASSIGSTLAGGFGSSGMGAGISGDVAASTADIAAAEGVGSSGASTFGGAALTGAASAGRWIPVVGWILAAMAMDSKLMGQGWNPDNGSIQGIGKGLGSASLASYDVAKAVGIPSGLANILTGASTISRLFGRQDPKVSSAGVDGMITVADGFQGQDFADWTAKGGVFRSDAHGTVNSPATQAQIDAINGTVQSTVATITQLSTAIGGDDGLQGKLSQFQYSIRNDWRNQDNITKSLTDLSNSLVDAVYPLDKYQQTGETLAQTATRLTGVFNATNGLADMLGKTMTQAFGAVGLAGADVRLQLVAAAGGISNFTSEVSAYYKSYYSGGEQLTEAQKQMQQSFAGLGLEMPKSKDAFRALVSSLDLTTASGQSAFAALMALAPAFDQMSQAMKQAADAQQSLWNQYFSAIYTPSQQLAMNTKQLQDQFNALGVAMPKTNADFQTLVENMDTSNPAVKALQNALLALAPAFGQLSQSATQSVQTALGNVQTAYNNQVQAINANISSITNFITQLTNLKQSLTLGNLSTLSPQDKYNAEKQLFESTSASAAAGDATAQGNLPQVAQDFLTASQAYNASSQAYVDDFNAVQKALDQNISAAQQQLSAAQQQLAATNQMVQGILNLNQTTQSLADALKAYFSAGGTATNGATGGNTYGGAAGSNLNLAQVQATAVNGLIPYSDANPYGPMGGYTVAEWQAANAAGPSAAFLAANPWIAQLQAVNGSHAGGLDSVPFDGYRAELHKGEAVVTSANNQKLSQMLSIDWSRYGRGDNEALVAEVKALRGEMAQMKQQLVGVGVAQMQQADQHQEASLSAMGRQARQLQTVGDNTGRMANKR